MATFWDHLAELRRKALLCVASVAVGAVVAHAYHEAIITFLLQPIQQEELYFLSPLDPLLFILKVDLLAGFVLAIPVLTWSALSFVRPAMSGTSWRGFTALYLVAGAGVLAGLAYSYYVVAPLSLAFLFSIRVPGVESMVTATSYLHFLLTQALLLTLVCQIPLVIIAGTSIGAFEVSALAAKRRYLYPAGLLALAILTPTGDLFNLGIIVMPAVVIFEGSLVACRVVQRLRSRPAQNDT